jgi:hypothetical protein
VTLNGRVAIRAHRDLVAIGRHPLDGVVEGVEEHPAAELAVRDHVEPELLLTPHDLGDRLVLERRELPAVARTLLGENGMVARRVEPLDRRSQRHRAQQAADHLGTGGSAWRSARAALVHRVTLSGSERR